MPKGKAERAASLENQTIIDTSADSVSSQSPSKVDGTSIGTDLTEDTRELSCFLEFIKVFLL